IDNPHAACALGFLEAFSDLNAAEYGGLADLRQTDDCQVANHLEAAGEAVELNDRLVPAGIQINIAEAAGAGFEQPQSAGMPARRMGHRKTAGDDLVRLDVDEDPAAFFVFAPATSGI